jgi:hypothetical protein
MYYGEMNMNKDKLKMWEEAALADFKALSFNMCEGKEEKHE